MGNSDHICIAMVGVPHRPLLPSLPTPPPPPRATQIRESVYKRAFNLFYGEPGFTQAAVEPHSGLQRNFVNNPDSRLQRDFVNDPDTINLQPLRQAIL